MDRRSGKRTMLRSKMGRPGLAMLGCGRRGRGDQIRSIGIGSHNLVAGAIAPGIAGIEGAPRHILVLRGCILSGRGDEGARGGGRTRLEHLYRATVLGDRLNQRSHNCCFPPTLTRGDITSVRVG